MCRHHIMEIVVKDVYHYLFASDTPNNLFYPILKEQWSLLRENDFPFISFNEDSIMSHMEEAAYNVFVTLKNRAITELRQHSNCKFIRDDYKEIVMIALKFFGDRSNIRKANQVEFHALIDPSNARFMATCLQGMKCYLFQEHLDWDTPERQKIKRNLARFVVFVSIIYIRYWNRSSILFDATKNDLSFLKEIQEYQLIDESVANVAMAAFNRHLYYMSEELSPLSLFSQKVTVAEKNAMREKLNVSEDAEIPIRQIDQNEFSNYINYSAGVNKPNYNWNSMSVVDLIGVRSNFFFNTLNINRDFLKLDASAWNKNRSYKEAKKTIENALVCVNDASERVISNCKRKFKHQRCRKENTFRQNILLS